MSELTVAGWILVLSLNQGPAVIPIPYSSEEACMAAFHEVLPKETRQLGDVRSGRGGA